MRKVSKEELQALRDKGLSYQKISDKLDISVSTIKRRLREPKAEVFPRYQSAVVTRLLVNARLIQVTYDGITRIAVKKPGYLYKLKQEVTLELVDEKTARVL
jgi:DNA-binding Lrp family transcriptional regulator